MGFVVPDGMVKPRENKAHASLRLSRRRQEGKSEETTIRMFMRTIVGLDHWGTGSHLLRHTVLFLKDATILRIHPIITVLVRLCMTKNPRFRPRIALKMVGVTMILEKKRRVGSHNFHCRL